MESPSRFAAVLDDGELVQLALRNTLMADALSLQFKLPPPGADPPTERAAASVAGGAPAVQALVITSVWVVHVLRLLGQARLLSRVAFQNNMPTFQSIKIWVPISRSHASSLFFGRRVM